ncbi:YegJ family protein [Devosia sp. ZW T5_3]|uniref:YegJ family protein n=1 Tax=Devosia sp. ZW T5_3 TaxID=3378085 RepID=UPI003851AFC0
MFAKPIAALVFALGLATPALAEDQVVDVPRDDAQMNAAMDKARAALPEFWARFADPAANEADFSLKLGISDNAGTEHFWCGEIVGDAKAATCVIANEPVNVHTVAYGERVAVDPEIISDWLYYRDGKIVGGETIRVLLPRLEKKEAAAMRALLAEP